MTTSENAQPEPERGPLATVLAASLGEARLKDVDLAAAALALALASEIDLGGDPVKAGPVLLRVLDALQMTPKSRAVAQRGGPGEPAAARSPFDELRERRARKRDSEAMDPTAP
jgi:hypothetical protein